MELHDCAWEKDIRITPFFSIHKIKISFLHFMTSQRFNLIYYDAFAPVDQPALWTKDIFDKLFSMMLPGGVLVTYCSKVAVRRSMQEAGFSVEKIQGPRGKREILRASTGLAAGAA